MKTYIYFLWSGETKDIVFKCQATDITDADAQAKAASIPYLKLQCQWY